MTATLRVTTPDEIADALAEMLHAAQREVPVHRKSEVLDELTPYDWRHRALDLLLTDWERARAGR